MGLNIVYNQPLTQQNITQYLLAMLIWLFVCTLGNIMLIYISELYQRL